MAQILHSEPCLEDFYKNELQVSVSTGTIARNEMYLRCRAKTSAKTYIPRELIVLRYVFTHL